jgi:hypothetical protein
MSSAAEIRDQSCGNRRSIGRDVMTPKPSPLGFAPRQASGPSGCTTHDQTRMAYPGIFSCNYHRWLESGIPILLNGWDILQLN